MDSTSGCGGRWGRSGATRKAGCRFQRASLTWPFILPSSCFYLGRFSPGLTAGWNGYAWSLAVVALCCAWNLRGVPEVGEDSVWMSVLLLAPFVVFVALGLWHGLTAHPHVQWGMTASGPLTESALSTAILVAMWNYMGWDNASTVAQEVENPQRNYPRAMIAATILVAVAYVLPLAAMAMAGISGAGFSTGDWTIAAAAIGGPLLGLAVVAGGMINGVGMFNALVMSYSRLPVAMAEDGMLPRIAGKAQRARSAVGKRAALRAGVGSGAEAAV